MNGFTSGMQALQGRAGSQKCYDCGDPATHQYRNAYGPGKHMPVCQTDGQYYRNQGESVPEYDVLDNPILAEFRISFGNAKTLPVTAWPNAKPDAVIQRWLRWVDNPNASSDDPEPWTAAERSHARRVLTKLAALAAPSH